MKQFYPRAGNVLFPAFFFLHLFIISSVLLPTTSFAQCSSTVLVVKQPAAVCFPGNTVNLRNLVDETNSTLPSGVYYTFYDNAHAVVGDPFEVNTGGVYYIRANDPVDNCNDEKPVNVVINQAPVISTFYNAPLCTGDQSSYSLSASNTSFWAGDGVLLLNGTYSFKPSIAGPGIHTLTAVNSNGGCTASEQVVVYQTPVIIIKQPAPVCQPASVDLTKAIDMSKSIIPANSTILYYFGTQQVANPAAVTQSGLYQVSITGPGQYSAGCSSNAYINVVINPTPQQINQYNFPICSSDNTLYPLGGTNSPTWTGDGVVLSNGGYSFNPSVAGAGIHTLVATTVQGCSTSEQIVVYQTPVIIIKQPAPVCQPASVDLTKAIDMNQSIIPANSTILYYFGTQQVANPSAVTQSGLYQVSITGPGQYSAGCSSNAYINVVINPTPQQINQYNFPICSSDNTLYPLGGTNSPTWTGDGVVLSNGGYSFNPSVAGAGIHTLTGATVQGCSVSEQIVVYQTPVLVLKNPPTVCAPGTVDLHDLIDMSQSIIPSGTALQYTSGGSTIGSVVSQSGQYTITATGPGGCNTQQFVYVSILTPPTLPNNLFTDYCTDFQKLNLGTQTVSPYGITIPMWIGDGIEITETVDPNNSQNKLRTYYFNPATAGDGSHVLTMTNGFSTQCAVTKTVNVHQTPVLVLTTPPLVCAPGTVDLHDLIDMSQSIIPGGTAFQYTSGGSTIGSVVSQSGQYTVTAISPSGCITQQSVYVSILTPPTLPNNLFTDYCTDFPKVNLGTQNVPQYGNTLPMWMGDGIEITEVTDPNSYYGGKIRTYYFNPATAGAGSHLLTMTNGYTTQCASTITVNVHQTPVLVLKTPPLVCAPGTVDLHDLIDMSQSIIPGGTAFQYTSGGSTIGSVVSQSGQYSVTAISPSGCITQQSVYVSILTPPTLPNNLFTDYCTDFPKVNLGTQNVPQYGNTLPMWMGDGIEITEVTDPNSYYGGKIRTYYFNPATAGAGSHLLTMTNGYTTQCASTITVNVHQTPVLVLKTPPLVCAPGTVDLHSLIDFSQSIIPAGTAFQYSNGTTIIGSVVSQSGFYTVQAISQSGCSSQQTVQVNIGVPPTLPTIATSYCSTDTRVQIGTQNISQFGGNVVPLWNGDGIEVTEVTDPNNNQNKIRTWYFNPATAGPGTHTLTMFNGFSTACPSTMQVTVLPPPTISNCPADITVSNDPGKCGAIVNYSAPTLTGGCGSPTITSSGPASGSLFPTGVTTITYRIKDANGNVISSCSFKVTVNDTEKPAITCNPDQVLNNDANKCSATYSGVPVATDNCPGVTVNGVRSDGKPTTDPYPVGVTTITWTATDAAGNTSFCTQKILVKDVEAPVITCNADILQNSDPGVCGALIIIVKPSATDNCSVISVNGIRSDGKLLTDPFPVGLTKITWTATDVNGNKNSCDQKVIVTDNEAPKITAPPTVNAVADNGKCSALGISLGTPVTSDNCGVVSVVNDAPATFAVGSTVVTWTVTDVNGNKSTATQTVIVSDTQLPKITGVLNKSFCGGTGTYSVDPVTVSDNCGVPAVQFTITGATTRSGSGVNASGVFNAGTSTIVWTAKDASGNTATWTTKVVVDNAIIVTIPDAYALSAGAAANTVYIGYSPASSITLKAMPSGGTGTFTYLWSNGATTQSITVSPTTSTTYTVTVKDASGCSATQSKTVNVVDIRCGNNKVTLCCGSTTGAQTLCVPTSQVVSYLIYGAKLGSCTGNVMTTVIKSRDVMEQPQSIALAMQAYPNPSTGGFTIEAKGTNANETARLVVYNVSGKMIDAKTVVHGQLVKLGSAYRPGIYFAELIQGNRKVTIKLVKRSE